MTTTRILVVDDHEVVRSGLRSVLDGVDGLEIVGEAATAEAAIDRALTLKPDIILMDVRLGEEGDASGIDACREVRSRLPETRVLMFSSYSERDAVVASILAGASGYVTKNLGRAQLIEALRTVGRGEALLDSKVTGAVIERLNALANAKPEPNDLLTPREGEVIVLIAQGLTNRQIAEELVISEHTARNHVASILDKLGFSRRSEAAAYAARLGLTEEGPQA